MLPESLWQRGDYFDAEEDAAHSDIKVKIPIFDDNLQFLSEHRLEMSSQIFKVEIS